MTFEDTFNAPKGPSLLQVRKSLEKAARALEGRPFGVLRCSRGGGSYTVLYGPGGRKAEAGALLAELKG